MIKSTLERVSCMVEERIGGDGGDDRVGSDVGFQLAISLLIYYVDEPTVHLYCSVCIP
jgi:hypothetical protein